ncbi:MAG: hypothetical protein P4N41_01175 [Negativicutes bacterium]|nr:hypothetical protein [Negativicutes bacterium]
MNNRKVKLAVFFVSLLILVASLTPVYAYGSIKSQDEGKTPVIDNSGKFKLSPDRLYPFAGVEGPADATVIPKEELTPWQKFSGGGKTRLAVLLTDTDSDWLALTQGLKGMGIPFTITTDYKQAVQHSVVLVYPEVGGKTMSPFAVKALMDLTEKGGAVIGVNVVTDSMYDFFGFDYSLPTDKNGSIRFNPEVSPVVASLQDPREVTIALGDSRYKEANYGTYGYFHPRHTPLAVFDSGQAAVTMERHGRGAAYAFGLDIGGFLAEGYNDRGELIGRSYINEFEPAADVLTNLVKRIYVSGEKDAVTVGSVPFNKKLTVMFTHDVDWGLSNANSIEYAKFEQSVGIHGTYFILTKYITDYNDVAFFNNDYIPALKQLEPMGMEVGSHGISHSKVYEFAPLGTGTEKYPDYQPYIAGPYTLVNGTVLGELRVSKYLLETLVTTSQKVVSFRPGELSNPKALSQALWGTGYKYSSTMPANAALTTLPFRLSYGKDGKAETPIFEFPLALEDELPPAPMIERLDAGVALADKIGRYGGICVILIHPNETGQKLEYEKRFYEKVKDRAWFSSVGEFGNWWSARDQVQVDVRTDKEKKIVEVTAPVPLDGLTLKVPAGWRLMNGDKVGLDITQDKEAIVIKRAEGKFNLVFSSEVSH